MVYEIAKFLHVLLAIAWLGAAFTPVFLGTLAARRGENASLVRIGRDNEILAARVFAPASVAVFLLGLYLVWSEFSFGDAWVILSLAGMVLAAAHGARVLSPMARQLGAMDKDPAAAAVAAKLLRHGRAGLVLLAVIVWDMVSKPAWTDVGEIAAMVALVVVVAGALVLRR